MMEQKAFLLDTNILVQIIRQNPFGRSIDQSYAVSASLGRQLISIVSIGEMYSLARQFGWGEDKIARLAQILEQVIIVDINNEEILSAYGEIDSYLKRKGKQVSQNDVWIAATCKATGMVLLTSDKDFDPLEGLFLQRIRIPESPENELL